MLVAGSVIIYWSFVSVIPVYNKHYFRKSLYPYPVATAGIQLGFVAVLLAVLNTLQHAASTHRAGGRGLDASPSPSASGAVRVRSWIFGPHFWWKVRWCFPIGALFGAKYGITNLGLHLVPAPTHLLLQSTDLVWTVLGAYVINAEVVSAVEMLCLAGCIAGSVVLVRMLPSVFERGGDRRWRPGRKRLPASSSAAGTRRGRLAVAESAVSTAEILLRQRCHGSALSPPWRHLRPRVAFFSFSQILACPSALAPQGWSIENSSVSAPLFAILVNLASPILLGLCLATLRLACTELMRPDNRVGGSVSSVELTAIKLVVSSLVALALACVMEGGDAATESWWVAFVGLEASTRRGVIGGAVLIAVFQVNCTFLTFLSSTVAVGLVG